MNLDTAKWHSTVNKQNIIFKNLLLQREQKQKVLVFVLKDTQDLYGENVIKPLKDIKKGLKIRQIPHSQVAHFK